MGGRRGGGELELMEMFIYFNVGFTEVVPAVGVERELINYITATLSLPE